MKAIVTGANGFVGSALVKKLVKNNIDVLCIDRSFDKPNLPDSKHLIKLVLSIEDIINLKNQVNFEEYDLFYHFAWAGSAGPLRDDENVQTQNALLNVKCLRVAKEIGCKKFISAGSIMEFEVNSAVYSQDTRPSLHYIYGVGKSLAHELCKPIANAIGIDLVWAYITNAYGVGELSPRFVNTTLRKIIHGEKLEFTSATQNYDFIYIDDVANAFYLLGMKGKANRGYIIGSGNARPLKEFINELIEANNSIYPPHFGDVPFSGVNLPLSVFDSSLIKDDCGFVPTISFSEGTNRTLKWLKEVDK